LNQGQPPRLAFAARRLIMENNSTTNEEVVIRRDPLANSTDDAAQSPRPL
jgi:hypothetical protein